MPRPRHRFSVKRIWSSTAAMRGFLLFFSVSPMEKYARCGGLGIALTAAKSVQPSNHSEPETQAVRPNGLSR